MLVWQRQNLVEIIHNCAWQVRSLKYTWKGIPVLTPKVRDCIDTNHMASHDIE